MKQVTSNIYKEATVKIFDSLNSCLHDVLELTPANVSWIRAEDVRY